MHDVLFFVEGFTDIRFVVGLSEISNLTLCVPSRPFVESGLKQRLSESAARVRVHEIPGGRLEFQARSFQWLWRNISSFDVVLSQEVLRGSLNAGLVGRVKGVPVLAYLCTAPVEYFRCRRERRQIGPLAAWAGERLMRTLMTINGHLATTWLALGPYLQELAAGYAARTAPAFYYGVDTAMFRPADRHERQALRAKLKLPASRFIILLSSRISHEKDPETVLRATAHARREGLDAMVLNVSGGYREFLALADRLQLAGAADWVLARPAVHPMSDLSDYYRAADCVAQASLAEGLGFSPLEALSSGTPVVATAVGGMASQLPGCARLTARRDAPAMARELLWIASHPEEARAQALRGREMVLREWSRERAFGELGRILDQAAARSERHAA